MRGALLACVTILCVAVVAVFQATRPASGAANPRTFVPAPSFYREFSPTYRTSIADAYWLGVVQYYGEHIKTDKRLDSLPAMLDLVTSLSPRFTEPYLFGSFALIDAGKGNQAYALLEHGFRANPTDWRFPAQLAFFAYRYGQGQDKERVAANWYAIASRLPGHPGYIPRLAAVLLSRGGDRQKAILMWGEVYAQGDKYAMQKAVSGLQAVLPTDKEARYEAIVPLQIMMSPDRWDQLRYDLFKAYF
jgi:hypothetical protein